MNALGHEQQQQRCKSPPGSPQKQQQQQQWNFRDLFRKQQRPESSSRAGWTSGMLSTSHRSSTSSSDEQSPQPQDQDELQQQQSPSPQPSNKSTPVASPWATQNTPTAANNNTAAQQNQRPQQHHRQYYNNEGNETLQGWPTGMPLRCVSIPSSSNRCLTRSFNDGPSSSFPPHGKLNGFKKKNSSSFNHDNIIDDNSCGDDSISSRLSQASSIVSEVTLMTYSDEKATLIKEAFFARIKQLQEQQQQQEQHQTTTTTKMKLTLKEKEDILREVQLEQEIKFKRQLMQLEKNKRNREKIDESDKASHPSYSSSLDDDGGSADKGAVTTSRVALPDISLEENNKQNQQGPVQQGHRQSSLMNSFCSIATTKHGNKTIQQNQQSQVQQGHRQSSLMNSFCSIATTKHGNKTIKRKSSTGSRENRRNDSFKLIVPEENGRSTTMNFLEQFKVQTKAQEQQQQVKEQDQDSQQDHQDYNEPQEKTAVTARSSDEGGGASVTSNNTKACSINDIIELKLQIANQQATIDTLLSKLHNLEVLNRQLMLSQRYYQNNNGQQSRILLSQSLKELSTKLVECRSRETSLLQELEISQKEYDSSNNREEQQQQRLLVELEQRNRELIKENEELKRQLLVTRVVQKDEEQ